MATNCSVYKHGIRLGTGTVAAGSTTISSWTADTGAPDEWRKNVQVQITGAGAWQGQHFNTRIITDNSTSLVMKDACPFVGA
jgi:hypothetical protein